MKSVRIRIRVHHNIVSTADEGEICLIHVRKNPDSAQVGNCEGLRLTRLHYLAGRDESLDNFAADWSEHRDLRRRRGLRQIGRIPDPENFHSLVGRIQIGLSLVAVRLGLLKVALGDGVVLIEILRTRIVLVRETRGIGRLQICVQQLRIIRTAHFQHWLARFDPLSGYGENAAHGPTNLSDHRRRREGIVSHRTCEPERAG